VTFDDLNKLPVTLSTVISSLQALNESGAEMVDVRPGTDAELLVSRRKQARVSYFLLMNRFLYHVSKAGIRSHEEVLRRQEGRGGKDLIRIGPLAALTSCPCCIKGDFDI
jgi:hypothetical protein